jgi:hypothetical protein
LQKKITISDVKAKVPKIFESTLKRVFIGR